MTHEQPPADVDLAALESGPALDAEIARRVFGFWYTDEPDWGPQWWAHHSYTPGARCYASVSLDNLWGVHVDQRNGLPKFSTSLEAAWKIVEKLRQQGWLVRVQEMPDGYPYLDNTTGSPAFYAKSLVTLDWMPNRTTPDLRKRLRSHIMERGLTTSEAICRAALTARAADERGYDYPLFPDAAP